MPELKHHIYLFEAVRPELVTDPDTWTEEDLRVAESHYAYLKSATDEGVVILAGRSPDGIGPRTEVDSISRTGRASDESKGRNDRDHSDRSPGDSIKGFRSHIRYELQHEGAPSASASGLHTPLLILARLGALAQGLPTRRFLRDPAASGDSRRLPARGTTHDHARARGAVRPGARPAHSRREAGDGLGLGDSIRDPGVSGVRRSRARPPGARSAPSRGPSCRHPRA